MASSPEKLESERQRLMSLITQLPTETQEMFEDYLSLIPELFDRLRTWQTDPLGPTYLISKFTDDETADYFLYLFRVRVYFQCNLITIIQWFMKKLTGSRNND